MSTGEERALPLRIDIVRESDREILNRLVQLYMHEESEHADYEVDDDGLFIYPGLNEYVTQHNKCAYLLRVKGKLAGFALVKNLESLKGGKVTTISDYFILNNFRGLGIGEEFARMMFDEHHGLWQIPLPVAREGSRTFWKKIVWRYSGSKCKEVETGEWHGTVLEFSSPGARVMEPRLSLKNQEETAWGMNPAES